MSDAIVDKLQKLATTGKSEYADNIKATQSDEHSYDLSLGRQMGTFDDMARINKYLSEAGLSPNNLNPFMEHGIVTTQGHTPLGMGDGKGGFHDKVALSDNVTGTTALGNNFGLHINLEGYSDKEIMQKLDKAIQLQKMDLDLNEERGAGRAQHKQRVRGLDVARDQLASVDSFKRRRSEADNVKTVRRFIEETVRNFAPNADITVRYDGEPNKVTEMVYNLSKPQFTFTIAPNDTTIDREEFSKKVNERIREKIRYNAALPVSGINSFHPGGMMKGELIGSAARLAAEIEGVNFGVSRR
jgi:hypothetical protein